MERRDILRKLIERGSDEMAKALYDRLCADRVAGPQARSDSPETRGTPTWHDLVARAVSERTLTPEETIPLVHDASEHTQRAAGESPPVIAANASTRKRRRARRG
jgi:hypothetical protein